MTKYSIGTVLALAALLAFPAYAAKTYTPQQLRKMVNSGNPPKQGSPTTQTQTMSFGACVAKVNAVV